MDIILASRSPRRKKLLKSLGLKFRIIPSKIKERLPQTTKHPKKLAAKIALLKAKDVAKRIGSGLVIGADTIVVLNKKVIGKPKNYTDARRILNMLSGATQYVITGIAVIDVRTKKIKTAAVSSKVKMKKMTPQQVSTFARKHMDKAGAYAVQEKGDLFIEEIEGSFSNVVGLPVEKLKQILSDFKIS